MLLLLVGVVLWRIVILLIVLELLELLGVHLVVGKGWHSAKVLEFWWLRCRLALRWLHVAGQVLLLLLLLVGISVAFLIGLWAEVVV